MAEPARATLALAGHAVTHVGGRKHNEDAYVTGPRLFAVADGMGGHDAGEVAARIVVESLHTITSMPTVERADIAAALRRANDEVYVRGRERPPERRLGTTVCGIALTSDAEGLQTMLVFNVGDSRTYLLRDSVLTQLTRDHSLVQEMVDAGNLTATGARSHRRRNVVTRAIGIDAELDIDFFEYQTVPGDRFLVCSDGIEVLTDVQLYELLVHSAPEPCAQGIVDAALAVPARDNVTAIVVDVVAVAVVPAPSSDVRLDPRRAEPEIVLAIDESTSTEQTMEIPFARPVEGDEQRLATTRRRTRKSSS